MSYNSLPAHEQAAVATYFEGDSELYLVFREASVAQFVQDVQQGDAACTTEDASGLRRLVHSLKTVLLTLGYEADSQFARQLEDVVLEHPWPEAVAGWLELRRRLIEAFHLPVQR